MLKNKTFFVKKTCGINYTSPYFVDINNSKDFEYAKFILKYKLMKKIKFLIPDILVSQNTAIIGNSSSILKKNGLKIDICDDVIRFNNAKTKGFEEYVGKKQLLGYQ